MKKNRMYALQPGEHVLKFLKIMRLGIYLVLLTTFTVSANSFSQKAKVTLNLEQRTVLDIIKELRKVSDYQFLYRVDELRKCGKRDLKVQDAGVEEVMQQLLDGTHLTWRLDDDVILIKTSQKMTLPAVPQKVKVIQGMVLDSKGEKLPGVTVVLKGTTLGGVTDAAGDFKFEVPEQKEMVLVFSFIGMKKQEVKYTGQENLRVILEEDVAEMEEVVVNGIFTRKKESFTGSSTTFTSKELKMVGNQSVLQSLKTLDPSFAIIENNEFGSDPNHLPDIEIRGKSSIIGLTEEYGTDPNQPLFILDGFESTLQIISDLSMDRVQNITILKDAAATAIYGSKAANGVVVVETKKPEMGQLKVNYNANLQFTFADLSDYNLMNSYEKLTFERLAGCFRLLDDDGNIKDEDMDQEYNDIMKEVKKGVDTYWMNEPLRFATTHKHTLFVEGGDEHMRYGAGLSYGNTQGVMKGSDREVMNGNVRLIYRRGRLAFTNNLNIDYSKANRESVPFSDFSQASPYHRKYDENGDVRKLLYQSSSWTKFYSPLYNMTQKNFDETTSIGFTNNFEVDWRVVDELRIRGRLGVSKSNEKAKKFKSPFCTEFESVDNLKRGNYAEENAQVLNYDGDVSITYGKLLYEKHMINAVGGIRFSQNASENSGYKVEGFIDDEFSNPAFALGYKEDGKATYKDSKRRTASYYLNLGYAYDNRYLLDANYRSDGSSVFGADKQFTNTWSVGLGWNIHNETFFREVEGISLLKLRASIGNPGNQNFDDYISTRIYAYNTENVNIFGSSAVVSNLGNRNLEWQKTIDRNIGLDVIFIDNRLKINLDYFNKKTDPLLVYIGTPSSTGTKTTPRNLGKQITKGVTLNLNYTLIRREEFNWAFNMNLRHLKSEYQDIKDALNKFNTDNRNRNLVRYYDGGNPSDLWAVRSCGIDPATGREIFLDKNGEQTFEHNYDDEVVVGNSDPKVEGVLGTSFYYKGFSASFNLRYRLGGQIFMQTLYEKVENISGDAKYHNLDKRALYDRWKNPGDQAKFKSIAQSAYTPMSSRFVEDNNVLSGESISLGYETQGKWLRHVGASSLTCRAYMNDIFRISTVKNERGLSYPFARSVSFSLGVRF